MTTRLPDGRIHHVHRAVDGKTFWHAHVMANGDRSAYRHPVQVDRAHPPPGPRPYPVRQRPFLQEAARQGTPDPVVPYDRLDLRVDPASQSRPYRRPGDRLGDDEDRPRSGWIIAWLAAIAIIAAVAFLIATRVPDRSAAPRTTHQPTTELTSGGGTTAGAGDTSPRGLGTSVGGSSGAPLEGLGVAPGEVVGPGTDSVGRGVNGGAPQTLDPRVGREGVITHMGDDYPWPIDYLAIPLRPGRLVRICGPAACRDMVSTDAGPSRERIHAGVIADVSWQRFETLCGAPARMGECHGSWMVMTSSTANVTPPPTDVDP